MKTTSFIDSNGRLKIRHSDLRPEDIITAIPVTTTERLDKIIDGEFINPSTVHVHPCTQEIDESDGFTYITADDSIPDSEAVFFGVYHIDAEGYEWWIKDFNSRKDAEAYVTNLTNSN